MVSPELYEDPMKDPHAEELRRLYIRHAILLESGVDLEGRNLFMVGDVTSPNAENMISSLHLMNSRGTAPIRLWINSCGGDDQMLFYMYDALTSSEAPIYTIGTGMICSAAALLLVCGDRRYATPNSWFMTHKGRFQLEGDEDEIRAATHLSSAVSDRYWKLIARHTTRSAKWWFSRSKGQGELWMDVEDMLKNGVIDDVLGPTRRNLPTLGKGRVQKDQEEDE